MSAGEGAPGAESQPGMERGWGRWWGVEALGGEAMCLGWARKVFPGAGSGPEHTDLGSRGKGGGGAQWEEKEGTGLQLPDTLTPLPTHTFHPGCWAWAPHPVRAQETHLSGFRALSLFFGLKSKRDRQRRGGGRGSEKPSLLLFYPRSQAYPGRSPGNLVPTVEYHHVRHHTPPTPGTRSLSSEEGPGWHLHSHWLCSSRDISPS